MKKILLLLVVALLIAGCGAEQTTEESTTETTTEEQTTVEVTEPAAEETAPTEEVAEEPVVEETTEDSVEEVAEETATETVLESISIEGCTDSDNGKDYATAGTMTDINGIEDHDICSTNENYYGRLYEVYCKEDGKHGRETYDCPSGVCQSGACVEATE